MHSRVTCAFHPLQPPSERHEQAKNRKQASKRGKRNVDNWQTQAGGLGTQVADATKDSEENGKHQRAKKCAEPVEEIEVAGFNIVTANIVVATDIVVCSNIVTARDIVVAEIAEVSKKVVG